jgi:endo-1,4-beta-xylanase
MNSQLILKSFFPFQAGFAIDGSHLPKVTDAEVQLMREQFDVLTSENCLKASNVHPQENVYEFAAADALLDFAEKNGIEVIGHCLVWHQRCPEWFFDDDGKPASREKILDRLRLHIHTLLKRYRGRIAGWDVVNEAIADKGEYLRDTKWVQNVGEDFLEKAFEFAHEADPEMPLFYNDYNIELPDKRERTLRLLKHLQSRGVRMDAVGIQGHWQLDQVPFDEIEKAIVAYHALGLKVMITELDIDVVERPDCGADVSAHRAYSLKEDPYRESCPPEILQKQAEQYAKLFAIFNKHREKITRVTFWGLHDGRSWLNHWPGVRTNHALLFDRQCRAKPALAAIAATMS